MSARKLLAALTVVCLLGTTARADEKDFSKAVVGKWEVTKADAGSVPPGAMIEFTKDGKLIMSAKMGETEVKREGTYTVDGNKIKLVTKKEDKERTQALTILKASDTELSIEGEDGKKVELTKKK